MALAGIALVYVSLASQPVDTTIAGTIITFSPSSAVLQQTSANNGTTRYTLATKTGLKYCWWGTNPASTQVQAVVHYTSQEVTSYPASALAASTQPQPLFCFVAQSSSARAQVYLAVTGTVEFSSMQVTQP